MWSPSYIWYKWQPVEPMFEGLQPSKPFLTLMLQVANLANTKWCKKAEKLITETLQMGTHLRVLSESYSMNTNMTWFSCFSKIFASLCFGRK